MLAATVRGLDDHHPSVVLAAKLMDERFGLNVVHLDQQAFQLGFHHPVDDLEDAVSETMRRALDVVRRNLPEESDTEDGDDDPASWPGCIARWLRGDDDAAEPIRRAASAAVHASASALAADPNSVAGRLAARGREALGDNAAALPPRTAEVDVNKRRLRRLGASCPKCKKIQPSVWFVGKPAIAAPHGPSKRNGAKARAETPAPGAVGAPGLGGKPR